MSNLSLQQLLIHNSNVSNRLSSLTKQVESEDLAKQMAEQGLYFKENFTKDGGIILCYVCGRIFDNPETNKSLDIFCQRHNNESSCWFPKVLDLEKSSIPSSLYPFYNNWPFIWISPMDVVESGFSITDNGASFVCYTCYVSIDIWKFPMTILKEQHKSYCLYNIN